MTPTIHSIPAIDQSMDQLERVVERVKALGADPADAKVLENLIASYAYITELVRDKQTSIARLRHMLFGDTSEKKEKVLGAQKAGSADAKDAPPASTEGASSTAEASEAAKGHGRNGAEAYSKATKVVIPHETLRAGAGCPHCKGRVHRREPRCLVRIQAVMPFQATIYEQDELRCGLCGELFPATLPPGVGDEKYDATVPSMIAVLRYGSGLPFYRIAALQEAAGLPMATSTQWDLVSQATAKCIPAHEELERQAAQGELVHNDDTTMVLLDFLKEEKERRERGEPSERTGIFTTGIVALSGERRIVLFSTGRRHAGENLTALLEKRVPGLSPPTQMCDGLDRNIPAELQTILASCLGHARRQFVDVVTDFPDDVRHVLEELAIVYRVDARTKAEAMTPARRMKFHQDESGPVMDRLAAWFVEQIDEKKVEPNSALGKAILYAQKRWTRLTLFLRVEGAPLDNNVCEMVLKRAILHRKNSLFYKTQNGARVGDLYMSLIATARLAQADPFDYLTEFQRHAAEVEKTPSAWMPWNYRETMAGPAGPPAASPPGAAAEPPPSTA